MISFKDDEGFARQLDADDPLRGLRDRFALPGGPGGDAIYLCGNSLGLLPRAAGDEVEQVLSDWGAMAVRGHHEAAIPWYSYHEALTQQTAAVVGARPGEVVNMNSLTANLHLMMISFYRPTTERHRIVIETPAFPSDRYAVESQIRLHGFDPEETLVELHPRDGEETLRVEDMERALKSQGERLALILVGGVQYLTGQYFDLAGLTRLGHELGAVVGFDLAHAVGNVPLSLHDWGADFAVWCSYKYLNGGPGAPGGCFVHQRHGDDFAGPRLNGWWGTDPQRRFLMEPDFHPRQGAEGWQLSNPPILSMAALKASLDIFAAAGMEPLRRKSERLTGFLAFLLRSDLPDGFAVITPAEAAARGCQISLRVPAGARRLEEDLRREGVVCDSREPDVLRLAPVPLYNTFHDVWACNRALRRSLAAG